MADLHFRCPTWSAVHAWAQSSILPTGSLGPRPVQAEAAEPRLSPAHGQVRVPSPRYPAAPPTGGSTAPESGRRHLQPGTFCVTSTLQRASTSLGTSASTLPSS
ncbi:hypothetical protein Cadr_000030998 [Camelus dromedarius]|uniref:Uncharacterized protein n=1 Tax=Camelus dromedarius TaxID=9838 RepID=A0A5N4C0G9_CAMDR|nr:hypothetical protein Cadr_000030998 [Camelus dromedarius]